MAGGFKKIDEFNKTQTPEEMREKCSRAGKASAEARRAQKSMSELAKNVLNLAIKGKGEVKDIEGLDNLQQLSGQNMTVRVALLLTIAKKALEGDIKAIDMLVQMSGEKVEKSEVTVKGDATAPLVQVYLPSNGRD